MRPFVWRIKRVIAVLVVLGGLGEFAQAQQTYTWSGGTAGLWSTGAWTPNGAPGAAGSSTTDVADLNNVSANTVVTYDGGASGFIGALQLTQTSGFTNELLVQKNLTIGSALTLGASGGGTSEVYLDPTVAGTAYTLTDAAGITIAAGGILELGIYTSNSSAAGSTIVGNISMTGGSINVEKYNGTSGNGATTFNGSFAMSGGTLTIGSATGGAGGGTANRLTVAGNFTATGGTLAGSAGTTILFLGGATNKIVGTSLGTAVSIDLYQGGGTTATTTQTLETDQTLGTVYLRGVSGSGGTATREIVEDNATATVGQLIFEQASNGGTTTLQMVNNLTVTSGATMPNSDGTGSPGAGATTTFVIDTGTAGYILDLSHGSGAFDPNSNGSATTNWTLEGNGTIKAASFTLNNASGNVTTSGNITLQATGAGGTTNTLSGNGTLGASTTFLYTGTGTVANPSLLVSNRAIGGLAVQTGWLKVNQASLAQGGGVAVTNGGGLDLNGYGGVGTLTLGSGQSFVLNSGGLLLTLGTSSDQIVGSGGSFSLSGLTLYIDEAAGFSFSSTYQVFSGFDSGTTLSGIALMNDSSGTAAALSGYVGNISSTGALSFSAAPEPPVWAMLVVGGIAAAALRRHRRIGGTA